MHRLKMLVTIAFLMVACSPPESDVDKCTNAWVKAVDPPKENRASAEAIARIHCMKAASGKAN